MSNKIKTLKEITFTDGHKITTKLTAKEAVDKMNRLNVLMVRIEDCDCDVEAIKYFCGWKLT